MPQKIIKTFLIEDFFYLPLVPTTPLMHQLWKFANFWISEKNLNGPYRILRGVGETDSWNKSWSRKSRGTVHLTYTLSDCTSKSSDIQYKYIYADNTDEYSGIAVNFFKYLNSLLNLGTV